MSVVITFFDIFFFVIKIKFLLDHFKVKINWLCKNILSKLKGSDASIKKTFDINLRCKCKLHNYGYHKLLKKTFKFMNMPLLLFINLPYPKSVHLFTVFFLSWLQNDFFSLGSNSFSKLSGYVILSFNMYGKEKNRKLHSVFLKALWISSKFNHW